MHHFLAVWPHSLRSSKRHQVPQQFVAFEEQLPPLIHGLFRPLCSVSLIALSPPRAADKHLCLSSPCPMRKPCCLLANSLWLFQEHESACMLTRARCTFTGVNLSFQVIISETWENEVRTTLIFYLIQFFQFKTEDLMTTFCSVPLSLQTEQSKAPTTSYTQTWMWCSSKHRHFFGNIGTVGRRRNKLLGAKCILLF